MRFQQYIASVVVLMALGIGAWAQVADADLGSVIPADGAIARTPPPVAERVFPIGPDAPMQVKVFVKVIEFQRQEGIETGFSAYFKQRNRPRDFGRISSGNGSVQSVDFTFPSGTIDGLTVFLDNISMRYGDIELVLQALEDENIANILSRPQAMVMVGAAVPTTLGTITEVPYEESTVVGSISVQATSYRNTGVNLSVSVPQVIDDDGDWLNTTNDSYIMLNVDAEVNEQGSSFVIALDDQLAGGGSNAIRVPEFVTRKISTSVWVRNNQVLVMGGLYRKNGSKSLSTLPWLTQGEDILVGTVQRFVPFTEGLASPVSATLGNRKSSESRRELVFMISAETWYENNTLLLDDDFLDIGTAAGDDDAGKHKLEKNPTDVITNVLEGISVLPKKIGEGISGEEIDSKVDPELEGEK